jgi:hypothetical protein
MYAPNQHYPPNQLVTMHNQAHPNRGFPVPNPRPPQGRDMYSVHPEAYSHTMISEADEDPLEDDYSDPGRTSQNYYNLVGDGQGRPARPPVMMEGFHPQRARGPQHYQPEHNDAYAQGGFYHQSPPYMTHDVRHSGGYGAIPTQPYEQPGPYAYGRPAEKVPSPNRGAREYQPPSKNHSPSLPTAIKKSKTPNVILPADTISQDNEENNSVPSRKSSQEDEFEVTYHNEKGTYHSKKDLKRDQRSENPKGQKNSYKGNQKGDYSYPENQNYSKKTMDEDDRSIKEACRDWSKQSSSRYLQQLLASESEQVIHSIVAELLKQFFEMSMNIFGNYVAQKMIEAGRAG